jgi:hypothetical protein
VLFRFIEKIMTAKGSFVQQRLTSDRMKISTLLNDQALDHPQNVLPSPHELPKGPDSARFLAVNTSASSVQETVKYKSTMEAGEPSSRCVASQSELAATSKDTRRASGRRRGATAIADDETPETRPKCMRGAVTPTKRPGWWQYTQEEQHFIWYHRIVLSMTWADINQSFSDRFAPRQGHACLKDKLRRSIRRGELPVRPKKDLEETNEGKDGQAISHATIEDVVKFCESQGYLWMRDGSRTAGSQSEV